MMDPDPGVPKTSGPVTTLMSLLTVHISPEGDVAWFSAEAAGLSPTVQVPAGYHLKPSPVSDRVPDPDPHYVCKLDPDTH
jgi:hypothetical protein